MNKLNVANMPQKILFCFELQGQISDGYWENSVPNDHSRGPCSIDWNDIAIDTDNLGINLDAEYDTYINVGSYKRSQWRKMKRSFSHLPKRNYNFIAKDLLDVVSDRMINCVLVYMNGTEAIRKLLEQDHHVLPENLAEYDDLLTRKTSWSKTALMELTEAGLTKQVYENFINGLTADGSQGFQYNKKQLIADLKSLKIIFKKDQVR